jgi:hypothetical protein
VYFLAQGQISKLNEWKYDFFLAIICEAVGFRQLEIWSSEGNDKTQAQVILIGTVFGWFDSENKW